MINTMPDFVYACGGRPRVALPSAQWLVGGRRNPFRVGCTLKNGAVTNSDLTTQDAWYEDVQVRTAFTPSDGATTKLRAILSIEAVRLYVSSSVFSVLDATVKDDAAAQMFLEADIGGQIKRIDMRTALLEPPREFQITQATAANGTHWLLRGDWAEHNPGPIVVDLETNSLALKTLNTPAFGADITQCWVEFLGHICPKGAPGALPYIPGSSPCGMKDERGRDIVGALKDPAMIAPFGIGNPQLARLPGW